MAAIDSLLRVLLARNADALALTAEQPPKMTRAGAVEPLTMPPISGAMLETFVGEVLTGEQLAEARATGAVISEYGDFTATVRLLAGDRWSLTLKKRPRPRPAAVVSPPLGFAPVMPASLAPSPAPVTPPLGAAEPSSPPPPPGASSAGLSALAVSEPAGAPDGGLIAAQWLGRALEAGAADLLLSVGRSPRLRVGGALIELDGPVPAEDDLLELLGPALTPVTREHLARHGAADLALSWPGVDPPARFRVNVFRQAHGLAAAFRPIRRDPPSLAELELPDSLSRLVGFANGLVLVVGPTGSGKSTTLVALIDHLNRTRACHLISLEDPIEFEHAPGRALIHQREIGAHVDSFEAGLRSALREAPDVILVGEMRDRATIAAALTAAETGHLVLSTLHAAGAAMAVERIVDVFPEHQQRQIRGQLAGTLRAILTQHLLPRVGGGLAPAIELALGTAALTTLIREGKTHQLATVIQTGRDDGMIALDRSLAELVSSRKVSLESAAQVTPDAGAQLRVLLSRR